MGKRLDGDSSLLGSWVVWQRLGNAYGVFEAVSAGGLNMRLLSATTSSNPFRPGSIYFGGTDPGRFAVTALHGVSYGRGNRFSCSRKIPLPDIIYLRLSAGNVWRENPYAHRPQTRNRAF